MVVICDDGGGSGGGGELQCYFVLSVRLKVGKQRLNL